MFSIFHDLIIIVMEVFLGPVITGSTELYRGLVAKTDSCDKDLNL